MDSLIEDWIAASSPNSQRISRVQSLQAYLSEIGLTLEDCTAAQIVDLVMSRRPRKENPQISAGTLNNWRYDLQDFFRWLRDINGARSDVPTDDLAAFIDALPPDEHRRTIATTTDVEGLLERSDPLQRAWIALLALEGFKASDIAELDASELDLNSDGPTRLRREGDRYQGSEVPLNPVTASALSRLSLPAEGRLFPGIDNRDVVNGLRSVFRGTQLSTERLRDYYQTDEQRDAFPRINREEQEVRPPSTTSMAKDHQHFWWVNQGATWSIEHSGGYLWAPRTDKLGRILSHHADMTSAKVGDLVVCYAQSKVIAVAEVSGLAIDRQNPHPEAGSKSTVIGHSSP